MIKERVWVIKDDPSYYLVSDMVGIYVGPVATRPELGRVEFSYGGTNVQFRLWILIENLRLETDP